MEKTKTLLADQIIKEITMLRKEYDKAIQNDKKFSVINEIRDKIKSFQINWKRYYPGSKINIFL
jgi:hypothetical protein